MSVGISSATSHVGAPLNQAERIQVQVAKTASDITEFIELPKRLFRRQRCWVAPLDMEVKRFISTSHPFRRHGDAELLLARKNGQVVGRLMVSDDPHYNAQHDASIGCFGLFHSIDDPLVTSRLLDAATRWLQERGRTQLLGPIDYSTNYPTGLLVDGFDTPPRVLMNHHPPYYSRLLENWGLHKVKDLYAWWFDRANSIDQDWRSRVDRLAARFGVVIRSIRTNDFEAEIARCHMLYNEAWQDNWGFVKMTEAEFRDMAHCLRKIATSRMIMIAEVDQNPVGLAITIPDINEAIAPLGGRLTWCGVPIGLARLLYRMRKVKTARLAALGVTPGYRRRGVAEMLIQRTFDYGKDVLGYTGAELSWTLEDNTMINRAIRRVGGRRYKTYRIYGKDLTPATEKPKIVTKPEKS